MSKTTDAEVWVISSGSYSDYSVHCVVNGTKSEAEALASRANASADAYHEGYVVESMPVVDPDVQRVEILTLLAEIHDRGPSIKSENMQHRVEWPFHSLFGTPSIEWRWVRAPIHNGQGGRLEVWGTDHERVRKVYSDRKAMLLSDDAMRAKRESRGRK